MRSSVLHTSEQSEGIRRLLPKSLIGVPINVSERNQTRSHLASFAWIRYVGEDTFQTLIVVLVIHLKSCQQEFNESSYLDLLTI